jgi:sucrose-6F-phosphate phosphohydrolase
LITDRLFICTDLDRTLIPNGPQPESPGARDHFAALVARPEVTLAYVSGRHRALIEQAIVDYNLPYPDFVVGDVGTTIYQLGVGLEWQQQPSWDNEIAQDWAGQSHAQLKTVLQGLPELQLQKHGKQNRYKLSYYLPLQSDRDALSALITQRLESIGVKARLVWSVDEPNGIGLLDILPARASKYHALEALMKIYRFDYTNTVFCGDSGNDIEVLASPIPAVLVANAQPEVRERARQLAEAMQHREQLYIARGNFMQMNGNYSSGMLEGIAHYHPETLPWMAFVTSGANA